MGARDLVMNISVNLGRIGRFAAQGRVNRVNQFISETDDFLIQLGHAKKTPRFKKTFLSFKRSFNILKKSPARTNDWAEEFYTWANILSHRSKLL